MIVKPVSVLKRSSSTSQLAWPALGLSLFVACAESQIPTQRDTGGGSGGSAGAATGGAGSGGTAGTFTAVSGSGGGGAGSGGSAGSSGSGGSAGSLAVGGEGGMDCAGGAPSCNDACPEDPDKTEPGECGCGVPDVDTALVAGCTGLKTHLVHRYSFDGTDTTITDSVGTAHGTVVGTTLSGNGLLTLTTAQYGELPDGIISSLTNASIESWVNWTANNGTNWQRIFDFGVSDAGAGMQGEGSNYLFLATKTFRFCYKGTAEGTEVFADATLTFPTPAVAHVVAVFDDANNQMKLYLNGALQDTVSVTGALSTIDDTNNWLGRSQFEADPAFGGSIREFRIYDSALTLPQIQRSYELGEEPEFLAGQ
jgi:hypothetical protein